MAGRLSKTSLAAKAACVEGVTRKQAEKILKMLLSTIKKELKRRERVEIRGFGTFVLSHETKPLSLKGVGRSTASTPARTIEFIAPRSVTVRSSRVNIGRSAGSQKKLARRRTRSSMTPQVATDRTGHLVSLITRDFTDAVRIEAEAHLDAGRPIHGIVDGRLVEVLPEKAAR